MIVVDKPNHEASVSTNISDVGKFTIKESAKAFRILSSALYANKIRAIVRELTCNARDSHVEAGNKEPYSVHLPTTYEPTFSVEDFGVGLSHDQVMRLYSTYFDSTKTNSNDFVGALGLGSKSPFSYTDNFVVVATKDGERNTYSAFINDEGVPSIARLASEKTDAPNGVKVQLAVKSSDFHLFRDELWDVATWYDMLPKVNLGSISSIELKPFNPFGSKKFKSVAKVPSAWSTYGFRTASRVLMGGVVYPIEASTDAFSAFKDGLLKEGLIFEANIGDVDIQPSREGLTYTQRTIDWILKNLNTLQRDLQDFLREETKECKTLWDKVKFLSSISSPRFLVDSARDEIKALGSLSVKWSELYKTSEKTRHFEQSSGKAGFKSPPKKMMSDGVHLKHMVGSEFFYVDEPKYRISDILASARNSNSRFFHVFFPKKGEVFDPEKVSKDFLYGAPIKKVSSVFSMLPRKEKPKKKTQFYMLREVQSIGRSNFGVPRLELSAVDRIPPAAKYYFLTSNRKVDASGVAFNDIYVDIRGPETIIRQSNLMSITIGVNKTSEKLAKALGLTLVWDAIEADVQRAEDAAKNQDFDSLLSYYCKKHAYSYNMLERPGGFPVEAIQNIKDEKIRSLWNMDWSVFEKDKLHWIYASGIKRVEAVKNAEGKSIAECRNDLYRGLEKYGVLNSSGFLSNGKTQKSNDDLNKIIDLINYVYDNF